MYYIYKRLVDSSYDLLESLTVQVIKLFLVFAEVKKHLTYYPVIIMIQGPTWSNEIKTKNHNLQCMF